jgi:hypothetical protein
VPPTQTIVEEDVELGGGAVVAEVDFVEDRGGVVDVVDFTEVDVVEGLDEGDMDIEVLEGMAEELDVDVGGGGGGAEPPVALKDPT